MGNREEENVAYDLSLLEVIKENLSAPRLQVNDKRRLDDAFYMFCQEYLRQYEKKEIIMNSF